jgi:hypothetical protein
MKVLALFIMYVSKFSCHVKCGLFLTQEKFAIITDPNYLFILLFLLGTVSLHFLLFTLVMVYKGMRISLASPYSGEQVLSQGI